MLKTKIADQHFILDPSGAAYWIEQEALLVADVHLGKSAHFRKNGIAVPVSADAQEYDKLSNLIDQYNAKHLWFLGDLFHSYINAEWHFFEQWIRCQDIKIVLIMGNHDVISKRKFNAIGVQTTLALELKNLVLTHHPKQIENAFNISGHIHPAVKLRGMGKTSLKVPCFHVCKTGMVLPAFGDFTGTYIIKPKKGDSVYAIAGDKVVPLHE